MPADFEIKRLECRQLSFLEIGARCSIFDLIECFLLGVGMTRIQGIDWELNEWTETNHFPFWASCFLFCDLRNCPSKGIVVHIWFFVRNISVCFDSFSESAFFSDRMRKGFKPCSVEWEYPLIWLLDLFVVWVPVSAKKYFWINIRFSYLVEENDYS